MVAAPPFRIGLVGAGMVSHHHLQAWAGIPQARVVAIADPDMARATEKAAAFRIDSVYADASTMLAERACDAVDIAAPVSAHPALCRLAADHCAAILCQKPLAERYDEARAIVESVAGRVRLMVHENWRFRSSYRQVKAWLDGGLIGRAIAVHMSVTSSGLIADANGDYPALRRQPFLADLPRMLVFELLIHHIDVLRWLCGDVSVETAELLRRCEAIRGEDTAAIRFRTAKGVAVALDGSFATEGASRHICDRLTITGTEGAIHLCDTCLSLEGRRSETLSWDLAALYQSAFDGAQRHFISRLADGGAFESEAADNIMSLQLVEAIYRLAGR